MKSHLLRQIAGALLVGSLLVTAVAVSPAQGHITGSLAHVWKHIKKKADKRYVLQAKAPVPSRTAGVTSDTLINLDGTRFQTFMETSITASTSGFLMISANGAYYTAGAPAIHCGLAVDGSNAWPDTYELADVATTDLGSVSCKPQTRIPVAAGTHTIAYQAHNDSTGSASFVGGSLLVTFEPYGSTGALGVGKPLQAPRGGGSDLVKEHLNSH